MSSNGEHNTDRRFLLATAVAAGAALPLAASDATAQTAKESAGPHHIDQLVEKIRLLDRAISDFAGAGHSSTMLRLVHAPGWTTLPEWLLVQESINQLINQVNTANAQYAELTRISGMIGS
jgi:opacity protein-like surface antigen